MTGRRLVTLLPLWPSLVAVSAVTLLVQIPGPHATAWHFFDDAANLLLGSGPDGLADGLHLYRDRPDLQFGPLSIATAVPFSLVGPDAGAWLAMITASLAGLLAYALVLEAVETLRPGFRRSTPPAVLFAGGVVVIVTWGDVAVRTAHIDDAIAWLTVAAALRWCALHRPGAVTLALAVAAAAKPWAIVFAPLALAASGPGGPTGTPGTTGPNPEEGATPSLARAGRWLADHRTGLARTAAVGLLAGLTWLPFALAEPATLETSEFGITNDATSVLRALGVSDAETPSWARPAQLGGGLVLVTLVVASGRWPAAVLAGTAWRLLLEPGANRYYTVGFVIGALVVELVARRNRIPLWTIAAAVVLELTALPDFWGVPGRYLRLFCVTAALVAVGRYPVRRDPDGPGGPGSSGGPVTDAVTPTR